MNEEVLAGGDGYKTREVWESEGKVHEVKGSDFQKDQRNG